MIFSPDDELKYSNRDAVQSAYLADEVQCVTRLLAEVQLTAEQQRHIGQRACKLVKTVREKQKEQAGLDAFLQEYDLSSEEGVVLLCLAEALLRIPDAETADQLIRDKLRAADWEQHLGSSASWFVNASTWGLMLTGKIISPDSENDRLQLMNSMMSRISEPVIRAALKEAMRILGHKFVLGRTIEEALKQSKVDNKEDHKQDYKDSNKVRYSYDMLGEAAISQQDADQYFELYQHAITVIGDQVDRRSSIYQAPGISVKLSALHPRFEFSQRARLSKELIPKVKQLATMARDRDMGLTIDGEEADRLDVTMDVVESVLTDDAFKNWKGLGIVVQAYQKRAPALIAWLNELLKINSRQVMIRLVKGAYWDTEIKRAQEQGLNGYPVFTKKQHTDISYLACARMLIALGDRAYLQFATHNAHTASAVLEFAGDRKNIELQRLYGMGAALHEALVDLDLGIASRVYAPVGSHKELLPYLVRRILENGANTSFVNRITDAKLPVEEVIADPVRAVSENPVTPHEHVPIPSDIYGEQRKNSSGINFYDQKELHQLQEELVQFSDSQWIAEPLLGDKVANNKLKAVREEMRAVKTYEIFSPVNGSEKIGNVTPAVPSQAWAALEVAKDASADWDKVGFEKRADILIAASVMLEKQRAKFIYLLVKEGGRCLPDAVAELREAVDFFRYYAAFSKQQLSGGQLLSGPTGETNELTMHGRGVFVCISPWNFPLAIFCGQIAAALATGNTVIAKPASQAPLIAMQAIKLIHEAGVPEQVLQFLPMSGVTAQELLIKSKYVDGVAFTGSTDVASEININLATRRGAIAALIAETGGQNAMIVDSSALPEQVVADVIRSAFNSAGQRCSALRILFVQQDVAARIIELLKGAMEQLKLGDPQFLETDVGPVIDVNAQKQLLAHIERMETEGRKIYQLPTFPGNGNGCFVSPCAFEIDSLSQLDKEVFGPVLHIIRYEAGKLDDIINDINNTHYGLTLGIHSRIAEKARYIQQNVRVGNIYVNRNIIGATVGVQPFGGEGLSGTGPKAGGPHYLYRFCTERVVTNNVSAIGGNASLLTLQ